MQTQNQKEIKVDLQIKKFCAYGFLKNLKFFEPYLILYFTSHEISLFQIGLLIAIRELIVNLFEIPSGLIADYFGRKKELYLCFGFYIASFIVFFFTRTFALATFGMVLFGLGEAFRSGTHKAMIYTYLDAKNWQAEKAFVYGRTRSFSLLGSATSSILGIVFILAAPSDNYIFLFSTVPYFLDALLIVSYPCFLDTADKPQGLQFKTMLTQLLAYFKNNANLRRILLEESMSEASYSYAKDLIQPLLEAIVMGSGLVLIANLSSDAYLKIMLGLVYTVLNLVGAYSSKKAYLLKRKKSSLQCLVLLHVGYALLFGLLALCAKHPFAVCALYVLLYVLHSVRKPLFVDEVENHIDKTTRATVLSTTAQLKSIFLMIVAPVLGLIADTVGIGWALLVLCILFACTVSLLQKVEPR